MNGKHKLIVAQAFLFAMMGSLVGAGVGAHAQSALGTSSTGVQAATSASPEASQDFQDVSPNSTFFTYIRNLYYSGVVSGYPCGRPGEPCGAGNLPYYRPTATVNRAEMAKFADNIRKKPGIFIDTTSDPQPLYVRTSVANGRAIQGDSILGNGIHGVSSGAAASGVFGENVSGGFGVAGRSNGGGSAIYGDNTNGSGYAGYFNGNVRVQGTLSKAAGSFEIDDPIDPANKYLYHSFVESPDMMNIYNGNVTLDKDGAATVQMPAWFEALNMEFRYQLTAMGAPGPNLYVAQEIANNQFKIAGGTPGGKVSWQVTGIRHDPYADQNRIPVEKEKTGSDAGKYLYPDLYNQPDTSRINPSN